MRKNIRKKIAVYLCGALMIAGGIAGEKFFEKTAKHGRESVETSLSVAAERPVIVLDAGHGGMDGGCVSADGTPEKGINLNILLSTRDMLRLLGYDVKCTREKDVSIHDEGVKGTGAQKRSDMDNRLAIINSCDARLALSIHQNKFTDPKYSGAQMFYKDGDSESSRLADTLRERFKAVLQPGNERETKPVGSELFLIHNAKCPAVMVECGFLSNPDEAQRLCSEKYQREIAFTLTDSINRFLAAGKSSSEMETVESPAEDNKDSCTE